MAGVSLNGFRNVANKIILNFDPSISADRQQQLASQTRELVNDPRTRDLYSRFIGPDSADFTVNITPEYDGFAFTPVLPGNQQTAVLGAGAITQDPVTTPSNVSTQIVNDINNLATNAPEVNSDYFNNNPSANHEAASDNADLRGTAVALGGDSTFEQARTVSNALVGQGPDAGQRGDYNYDSYINREGGNQLVLNSDGTPLEENLLDDSIRGTAFGDAAAAEYRANLNQAGNRILQETNPANSTPLRFATEDEVASANESRQAPTPSSSATPEPTTSVGDTSSSGETPAPTPSVGDSSGNAETPAPTPSVGDSTSGSVAPSPSPSSVFNTVEINEYDPNYTPTDITGMSAQQLLERANYQSTLSNEAYSATRNVIETERAQRNATTGAPENTTPADGNKTPANQSSVTPPTPSFASRGNTTASRFGNTTRSTAFNAPPTSSPSPSPSPSSSPTAPSTSQKQDKPEAPKASKEKAA